MKFNELRAIGHNIADSLASGCGFMIGVYQMDIFGEAGRSTERFINVDFLTGSSDGATPSPHLANAITLYEKALTDLCKNHGTSPSAFKELTARYTVDIYGGRFQVTVADHLGHRSADQYVGTPGRRIKVLDHLGRIRTIRLRHRHQTAHG